jgi:hypothetical protein
MTTTDMTPSRPGRNPRGRTGQSRDLIAALHAAGGELQRLALLAGTTLGNHPAHNEVLLEIAKVLQKARDDRRALRAVSSRRSAVAGTQDATREPDRPELFGRLPPLTAARSPAKPLHDGAKARQDVISRIVIEGDDEEGGDM